MAQEQSYELPLEEPREQRLVLGPTVAWAAGVNGYTRWFVRVLGRVFQPAQTSRKRQLAIDALASMLPVNRRLYTGNVRATSFPKA